MAFKTLFLLLYIISGANGLSKYAGPKGSKKTSSVVLGSKQRMLKEDKKKFKGPSVRDCKMKEKNDKVEFECKAKDTDTDNDTEIKDKIKFKVSTGEKGLAVKIEYEQEIKANSTETETETEYEVVFDSLIEYAKTDEVDGDKDEDDGDQDAEDDAFDWENDTIVQSLPLDEWTTFSEVVDDDDGVISFFEVSTKDGVAIFNFTISRADKGDKVTANKMKIDVYIDSFPWLRNDTYVALLSTVESKKEIKVDYDTSDEPGGPKKAMDVEITFEEAQDAIGIIPFGEYTWEDTAEVLNVTSNETDSTMEETIEVVATSPEINDADPLSIQNIAFSFVGEAAQMADLIYWDPETGIGYAGEGETSAGVIMMSGGGSLFWKLCALSTLLFAVF